MATLKYLGLAASLLLLAACGQMEVPEVVQDDVQLLSDISEATTVGSTTSAVAVNGCVNGSASEPFSVVFTVTGRQGGTATFQVNRDYIFDGTAWVGSNPTTVTVPAQVAGTRTIRTIEGISLKNGGSQQSASNTPYPFLRVTPFGLTNTATPTLDLKVGDANGSGHAEVFYKFLACTLTPPANTAPSITVPGNYTNVEATSAAGAAVDFAAAVSASDEQEGDLTSNIRCTPASGSTFPIGKTTISCSVTDSGGMSNAPGTGSFTITVVDTTAPVISGLPSNQTLEATGPSGALASWTAPTANDLVDGSVDVTCDPTSGSTFALGETTVNCTAEDTRGNSASQSFTVKIQDTTPPTISWNSAINNGDSFYFGSVPAAPSCTASDLVAGTVTCNVTGHSTAVGTHTLTATATDGTNQASQTRSYTVLNWTLKGFYSPVDMGGIINTVKGGSTVPLKFEIFAASELTNTSAVSSFKTAVIGCSTLSNTVDEIEVTTTGGTSLRYDAIAGQYIQNWQTPKAAGVCYRVTMTTLDGSTLAALFKTK